MQVWRRLSTAAVAVQRFINNCLCEDPSLPNVFLRKRSSTSVTIYMNAPQERHREVHARYREDSMTRIIREDIIFARHALFLLHALLCTTNQFCLSHTTSKRASRKSTKIKWSDLDQTKNPKTPAKRAKRSEVAPEHVSTHPSTHTTEHAPEQLLCPLTVLRIPRGGNTTAALPSLPHPPTAAHTHHPPTTYPPRPSTITPTHRLSPPLCPRTAYTAAGAHLRARGHTHPPHAHCSSIQPASAISSSPP